MSVVQTLSSRVLELTQQLNDSQGQHEDLVQKNSILKEQLAHQQQESNELQQRYAKLKQVMDQLHDDIRTLKSRNSELELERYRIADQEDQLVTYPWYLVCRVNPACF